MCVGGGGGWGGRKGEDGLGWYHVLRPLAIYLFSVIMLTLDIWSLSGQSEYMTLVCEKCSYYKYYNEVLFTDFSWCRLLRRVL